MWNLLAQSVYRIIDLLPRVIVRLQPRSHLLRRSSFWDFELFDVVILVSVCYVSIHVSPSTWWSLTEFPTSKDKIYYRIVLWSGTAMEVILRYRYPWPCVSAAMCSCMKALNSNRFINDRGRVAQPPLTLDSSILSLMKDVVHRRAGVARP